MVLVITYQGLYRFPPLVLLSSPIVFDGCGRQLNHVFFSEFFFRKLVWGARTKEEMEDLGGGEQCITRG